MNDIACFYVLTFFHPKKTKKKQKQKNKNKKTLMVKVVYHVFKQKQWLYT